MPCPYLAGRMERKLVVELTGPDAGDFYSDLSRAGFRRSQRMAYRPTCRGCGGCVPVRVRVKNFGVTRSLRRVLKRGSDLSIDQHPATATGEQFRLFARYQQSRHVESDMATMSFRDYQLMVEETATDTALVEFRDPDQRLVAACLYDRLQDGLSGVYSFFDPDFSRRSLGTLMILWLIEQARALGLPFVYLGYWIDGSPKMAYKGRFPGVEQLTPTGWRAVEPVPDETSRVVADAIAS